MANDAGNATVDEVTRNVENSLRACSTCGRTFLPESLRKHLTVCERNGLGKRKVFDSFKQRLEGTQFVTFGDRFRNEKWNTAGAGGGGVGSIAGGEMSTSTSPRTTTTGSKQCPTCDRQFGHRAYDRHVEWCKQRKANDTRKSPADVLLAKERLEARTKYRVPLPAKSKRCLIRDKYSANRATSKPVKSVEDVGSGSNPFLTAERQLMELLECEDSKPFVRTTTVTCDSTSDNKCSSLADPPTLFQDGTTDFVNDDFEIDEYIFQRDLHSLVDTINNLKNWAPTSKIDDKGDECGDLFIPDGLLVPQDDCSSAADQDGTEIPTKHRRPPSAVALEDFRKEDEQKSFCVDDELLEEYRKYEEMFLDEKKRAQSTITLGTANSLLKNDADSACSSLNRKSGKMRARSTKLSPLRQENLEAAAAAPAIMSNSTSIDTETISTITQNGPKRSKFCHECGQKFPVATANFCVACGVKRLVL